MEEIRIDRLERAMGLIPRHAGVVTGVCTDSRRLTPGCLFIALRGERFDGHAYIAAALNEGAAFAVSMQQDGAQDPRVLYVPDTGEALLQVARCYRQQMTAKVVGVTGSVGKTSAKEMIYAVLSAQFETVKTKGNLNNEIGLPQTLFQLEKTTQAAVVELGMSGFGEIAALAKTALPDIGVITNIGVSHLEALGSRENILKAKLELAEQLPDGAPLILCGDNDLLCTVDIPRLRLLRYGIENPHCHVRAKDIVQRDRQTSFTICWGGRCVPATIPCIGVHQVLNALAAFCVGLQLGMSPVKAAAALTRYEGTGMRQHMVEHHGFTVVEDCYNASPDSMRAAITTMQQYPCQGRRILVLADMLELGGITDEAHAQVGEFAAGHGVDLLLCFGQQTRRTVGSAGQAGLASEHFDSKERLVKRLVQELRPGDLVWFKGSRGMKLEDVIHRVYEEC